MTHASLTQRPTMMRYVVLAVLCSLAFVTYLDRICIMRVQEDIATDLHFDELTPADEAALQNGESDNYRSLLKEEDEKKLAAKGQAENLAARRESAFERLKADRVNERIAWVFFAFYLGYALFEIPGGWLGDRWGPRRVIVRIVIWWSAFTALTGSVDQVLGWFTSHPGPALLLAGMIVVRFLFGIGEAGAYPNVGRALARWFPYRERGLAQGGIWMASRCGGALSPLIIGALMAWLTRWHLGNWRQAFWLLGGVGAVWAVGFGWWFRNRPEEKGSVNEAERELIRAQAADAGSIYDESHHFALPWGRLLGSLNLYALYIAAAAVSFSWYINVTFLPRVLKDKFELGFASSEWLTGLPLLVSSVFCLAGGALSDWLIRATGSKRWGRSLPGVIGFTVAGGCFLLIPYAKTAHQAIALICIACALQDLAIPCIWSVCADIGGQYAGTVSGCMNAVGGIGAMLSAPVASHLNKTFGWNTAFLVFAASYFIGALMWLRIDASETLFADRAAPVEAEPV